MPCMRRTALLIATASVAGAAPAVAALAAEAPAVPTLGVRVADCRTGLSIEQRAAEFTGSMPAIVGSSVLAMRFDLERRPGGGWKPLSPPGFGRWERSAPGAAGFVYVKRVERLAAGSAYRVRVRFRWSAPDGTVLRRATRTSGACRVADLRPDLSIEGLTADPLPDGRARYVVQVRNGGETDAFSAVRVGLTVDGVAQVAKSLPGLTAAALGSVVFEGSACRPGGNVLARVDPQDGHDEADEADNTLELPCSAG